ncbi:MAG: DUF4272 domain-containing protein [Myxococcaceae bacterium]|nr:DUF4272 domain-containing protein [Myxococcaceae bacterium]
MSRKPFGDDDETTVTGGQPLPSDEPSRVAETTAAGEDEAPVEDFDAGDAPDAEAVVRRALAAAALLRRLDLEQARAPLRDIEQLESWVDENGLHASFGPTAFALFGAPPGEWTDEDADAVAWGAEELSMLGWALGRTELPGLITRADVTDLLAALPRAGDLSPFVGSASLLDLAEVDAARSLFSTLEEAARIEAFARGIATDPDVSIDDQQLEDVFGAAAHEGFDRDAVTAEHGDRGAAVEVLRFWTKLLLEHLFADGGPFTAFRFTHDELVALEDDALALLLTLSQLRAETLSWLLEGAPAEDDGEPPDQDG